VREKIHVVYERKMVRGAKEKEKETVAEWWGTGKNREEGEGFCPQGVVPCGQKCGTGIKRPRGPLKLPAACAGGSVTASIAFEVSESDNRVSDLAGVSAAAGANRCRFQHFAGTGNGREHERATDCSLVHVLIRTNCLLDIRDVQNAPGAVRAFSIGGNADEEDGDESEKHRDDEGNLDKGESGLFPDVVLFHYVVLLYVLLLFYPGQVTRCPDRKWFCGREKGKW